ncbi:hypothetical protein PMI09_02196 [Rhizobium sp. CF122]|nr:hypothetical protein PMI09_02196 [Rhizobium sp. CF122]
MTARRWVATVNNYLSVCFVVDAQKPPITICAGSKFSKIFQFSAPSKDRSKNLELELR